MPRIALKTGQHLRFLAAIPRFWGSSRLQPGGTEYGQHRCRDHHKPGSPSQAKGRSTVNREQEALESQNYYRSGGAARRHGKGAENQARLAYG